MLLSLYRIPVRLWFRIGLVGSLLWVPAAGLWHWAALAHEMTATYLRHVAVCEIGGTGLGSNCLNHAAHQLDTSRENAWRMALAVSVLQLVLLWLAGIAIVVGARWAIRPTAEH